MVVCFVSHRSQPLASFLIPENKDTDIDTLLTTGEVYNNYVRAEISYTPVRA